MAEEYVLTLAARLKEHAEKKIQDAVSQLPLPEPGKQGERGEPGAGIDNLKVWSPGVYREDTWVHFALGKIYRSTRDTADVPGKSDAWERVGISGFEFCGVKDQSREYEIGDIYIDGGSAFIWLGDKAKMLAQRGREGKKGEKGNPGLDGRDGKDALDFVAGELTNDTLKLIREDNTDLDIPVTQLMRDMVSQAAWMAKQIIGEEDIIDDRTYPIRVYRGPWLQGKSYRLGDTVNSGRGLYLCIRPAREGTALSDEYWRRIAGAGGTVRQTIEGGGDGGGPAEPAPQYPSSGDTAPSFPAIGELWVDTSGGTPVLKIFDGSGWDSVDTDTTIPKQTFPPPGASSGDLWVDTSDTPPTLKVYDGGFWINVDTNTQTPNGAVAPSNPQTGDLWVNTALNPPVLNVYDGASWIAVDNDTVFQWQGVVWGYWRGTQAEYDAIAIKDSNIMYAIVG